MSLEITAITIQRVKREGSENPLLAFVRIVLNGELVITSIKIIRGKFGIFVSFPRDYDKAAGKGHNIVYPCTKAFHERLTEKILAEYRLTEGETP